MSQKLRRAAGIRVERFFNGAVGFWNRLNGNIGKPEFILPRVFKNFQQKEQLLTAGSSDGSYDGEQYVFAEGTARISDVFNNIAEKLAYDSPSGKIYYLGQKTDVGLLNEVSRYIHPRFKI
jgi:hypothetical protein